jgi:hypothetical protein
MIFKKSCNICLSYTSNRRCAGGWCTAVTDIDIVTRVVDWFSFIGGGNRRKSPTCRKNVILNINYVILNINNVILNINDVILNTNNVILNTNSVILNTNNVILNIQSISIFFSTGRWFSPVSSTNKTDRHDITEILLKVSSNKQHQTNKQTIFHITLIVFNITPFNSVILTTNNVVLNTNNAIVNINNVMLNIYFFK